MFNSADPFDRRDITRYIDVSAVMKRLGLKPPMKIYDARLPENDGSYEGTVSGSSYPSLDLHCIYVDLVATENVVNDALEYPEWAEKEITFREQLPAGVPFTFEDFLRASIAHEMFHLTQDRNPIAYQIESVFTGYEHNSAERDARKAGREMYQLVNLLNVPALHNLIVQSPWRIAS